MTPMAQQLAKEMNYSTESMDRSQMAVLALTPPMVQAITTMRLKSAPELIESEFKMKDKDTFLTRVANHTVAAGQAVGSLMGHTLTLNMGDLDEFSQPHVQAQKLLKGAVGMDNAMSLNRTQYGASHRPKHSVIAAYG